MANEINGNLLLKISSTSDAHMATKKWPVLMKTTLKINDEVWEVNPPMPHRPKLFALMRDGQEVFGCTLNVAISK